MHDPKVTHYAAHNAAFDRRFFTGGQLPWICTLKAAYKAFPKSPAHNNQTIRYLIDLDASPDFAWGLSMPSHRALPDAYVTAHILRFLLDNGVSLEAMIQTTIDPALLPRLAFGKHAGTSWDEVPTDYLEWLTRNHDDRDVKHTARHWIKKKSAVAGQYGGGGFTNP